MLRSASSDIEPATICRSIPAYRPEGNLPETIRLKSRPARANAPLGKRARARVDSPSSPSRETISPFVENLFLSLLLSQGFANEFFSGNFAAHSQ